MMILYQDSSFIKATVVKLLELKWVAKKMPEWKIKKNLRLGIDNLMLNEVVEPALLSIHHATALVSGSKYSF